jgi:hypothetical protein
VSAGEQNEAQPMSAKAEHPKTKCSETNSWYGGSTARPHSGHWTVELTCPLCGRIGKFLSNFLGQRKVFCNGLKFTQELIG